MSCGSQMTNNRGFHKLSYLMIINWFLYKYPEAAAAAGVDDETIDTNTYKWNNYVQLIR